MRRILFLAYGITCHLLFLVIYAWMAAWVGNFGFGWLRTIDSEADGSLVTAICVNLALVLMFGLQHSVMARPTFKKWWTRFIPEQIERSTYVLFSCIAVAVLLWQWRPMGGVVWNVENSVGRVLLHALFAFGWVMVPAVSLLINHFDLFGTRQVWLNWLQKPYTNPPFRTPSIYKHIRHPLYVGWLIAFWATPTMTLAHLVFAVGMTAYILIAIPFEERNLIEHFGPSYADYKRRVGAFIPRFRQVRQTQTGEAVAARAGEAAH